MTEDAGICKGVSRDGKMSTERTRRLYKEYRDSISRVSVDRARLFTEAFRSGQGEALILRRAKAYRYVLERAPIAIHTGELIVGGQAETVNTAILFPETNVGGMRPTPRGVRSLKSAVAAIAEAIILCTARLAPHLEARVSALRLLVARTFDYFDSRDVQRFAFDAEDKKALVRVLRYWRGKNAFSRYKASLPGGIRRLQNRFVLTADNQFVGGLFLFNADISSIIDGGLEAAVARARAGEASAEGAEARDYFRAVIVSLEGLAAFARRHARLAEEMASKADSAGEKAELEEIARICDKVPWRPAGSFREALQAAWFAYLGLLFDDGGMEIPFGRLDQELGKHYIADLEKGMITEQQARELVECFYIKASEISFLLEEGTSQVEDGNTGRLTLTIGGLGPDGEDSTNELSSLFLDVAGYAGTLHPNIAVRVHGGTPRPFFDKAMEVIASGANSIQLFGDEAIIAAMRNEGIPIEDARDYIISGCVQPLPRGGYGSVCASHIVAPRTLELFMNGSRKEYGSFDAFFADYLEYFAVIIDATIESLNAADRAHLLLPNPFVSALSMGSMESGRDVKSGGGRHNLSGINLIGIGTLVDSLAAIRRTVFEEKRFSLQELALMTRRNFIGFRKERAYLQAKVPKFGNDEPGVDELGAAVVAFAHGRIRGRATFRGGKHVLGLHSEAGHVVFGSLTGATPNGRAQPEPLSVGSGPSSGKDTQGYTATLASVLALGFGEIAGGASVNIRVNPELLRGEGKLERFASMGCEPTSRRADRTFRSMP